MKKILFALIILLISCEQTVKDPDLPYVEKLVIESIFTEGEIIDSIIITRTLPPLGEYSFEKALVTDAEGYIEIDGEKHELEFNKNQYDSDLTAKVGKKYKLAVRWKNLKAYATTFVPPKVTIDTAVHRFVENEWDENTYTFHLNAVIHPIDNTCYSGKSERHFFYDVRNNTHKNNSGRILVPFFRHDYIISDTTQFKLHDPVKGLIYSFDESFYDYFNTRDFGNEEGTIFGISGRNVEWNVKGDGLGLFMGYNVKEFEVE